MKRTRILLFALATFFALAAHGQVVSGEHIPPAEAATHLLSCVPQPNLPPEAKRIRLSGSVCLEVTIAPSGDVAAVQPIVGHPLLIAPAVQAVKQWKYKPFIRAGEARTVRTELCVDYARPRANRTNVTPLALSFACLLLCGWAWKVTLESPGQTLGGIRFAIGIAALVAASLSALVYLGFGVAWVAFGWTGGRPLMAPLSTALCLVSGAALFGSASLPRGSAIVIGALASAVMACLWFLNAAASIAV